MCTLTPPYELDHARLSWLRGYWRGFKDRRAGRYRIRLLPDSVRRRPSGWNARPGWIPDRYPKSWPSPYNPGVLPPGVAPFSARIEREIAKRKQKIKADLANAAFLHYPKDDVVGVLKFWNIDLGLQTEAKGDRQ